MKQAIESSDIKALRKILEGITSDLRNSFAKCIKAGELFTKIKANTKHGDWDGVLQAVGASFNTAKRYMTVWERRAELNLNEIKTLSDAENVFSKIARLEITTAQNEPLTNEKRSNSEAEKRSGLGTNSGHTGTARREAKGAEPKTRPSSFDADQIPRDNMGAYLSGPVESENADRNGAPKTPEVRTDKEGYPIPESLLPEWDRATTQALTWIREFDAIHRQVMNLHGKDFALARINKASLESLHSNYRETLKQAIPHAVCVVCQGKNPDRCKECNPCKEDGKGIGLGWVNKHFWENCEREDLINMRRKSYGTKSSARLSA